MRGGGRRGSCGLSVVRVRRPCVARGSRSGHTTSTFAFWRFTSMVASTFKAHTPTRAPAPRVPRLEFVLQNSLCCERHRGQNNKIFSLRGDTHSLCTLKTSSALHILVCTHIRMMTHDTLTRGHYKQHSAASHMHKVRRVYNGRVRATDCMTAVYLSIISISTASARGESAPRPR